MMSDNRDKTEKTPDEQAELRYRMRHDWNNLIEDLIEEGKKRGVFDNLPGKGKPLKLKRNLFAPETELAHDLLKHNDLKPAWILARGILREQIDALRAGIRRSWQRHEQAYRLAQGESHRDALILSWDDACQRWQDEIADLNKQVDGFNLKRPSDGLEMFKLELERELERAGARRYLRQL